MITWKLLSENVIDPGILKDFDWKSCKSILDIELNRIPRKYLLNIINDYITYKIANDIPREATKNIKNLDQVEKDIYCAYQYHLTLIMDGFFTVFTGYYSPLLYEIRNSLEHIGAVENYEILDEAIRKINIHCKNENDFLKDVEDEELNHLYDEKTEDKYDAIFEELYDRWHPLYWENTESIEDKLLNYIEKHFQLTIAST